jgi:hypothetical protein
MSDLKEDPHIHRIIAAVGNLYVGPQMPEAGDNPDGTPFTVTVCSAPHNSSLLLSCL